ncbi:MAG: PQQ-binding-like beta-propeller repeat protein [Pirellulaceae bacterium]|jgi:outer membrane protein assembly factor BamB|nr:PQQ-binding-like beta-propeller repeat protein [Pirellulaceae bacterium]
MPLRFTRRLALLSLLCSAVCSVGWLTATARAQVSSVDASQLGLEIAWKTQLQLPKVGRGITTSSLWVDNTAPRKYAVVELGEGRTIEVSADELDSKGVPIGIEVAKQMAGERAARLLGKNDGFEVIESSIPKIYLVVATSDGLIQNYDAETGRLLWSRPCGVSTAPAQSAALSPSGVSLIHGRHLYLLDWESGKQLQRQELKYGSSIALAVCGRVAYITDFRGRLEAYGLGITFRPWTSQIAGRDVGRPVTLADQSYCAIASTEGYVYTMVGGDKPGMWTRYEASSPFNGSLAAGNHAFYAGSSDGVLAKVSVDDQFGSLNWDFTTGESLTAPPLVINDRVYLANESGTLHCLDDANGSSLWSEVGLRVVQPFAVAGGKLYCSTVAGRIIAVDAESGRFIAGSQPMPLAALVINQSSDRLYVADTAGRMQCLRPWQSTLPRLVEPLKKIEGAPSQEVAPTATETTPAAADQDPFNVSGGAAASPAGSNPFDSASDPFGTVAPTGDDTPEAAVDPFGTGASDPFSP